MAHSEKGRTRIQLMSLPEKNHRNNRRPRWSGMEGEALRFRAYGPYELALEPPVMEWGAVGKARAASLKPSTAQPKLKGHILEPLSI